MLSGSNGMQALSLVRITIFGGLPVIGSIGNNLYMIIAPQKQSNYLEQKLNL